MFVLNQSLGCLETAFSPLPKAEKVQGSDTTMLIKDLLLVKKMY